MGPLDQPVDVGLRSVIDLARTVPSGAGPASCSRPLVLEIVGLPGSVLLALVLLEDLLLFVPPLLCREGPAVALLEALALPLSGSNVSSLQLYGNLVPAFSVLLHQLLPPPREVGEALPAPEHRLRDDAGVVPLLGRAVALQLHGGPARADAAEGAEALALGEATGQRVVLTILGELGVDAMHHPLLGLDVSLGHLHPGEALVFLLLDLLLGEVPIAVTRARLLRLLS
mmetsp:Transcript_4398/g.12863  ORF Transcript_4398/g.12863 Transcript_4398/m.12863 type:complete len:228 (+) Transcript_4398:1422-2105(+)